MVYLANIMTVLYRLILDVIISISVFHSSIRGVFQQNSLHNYLTRGHLAILPKIVVYLPLVLECDS